MDRTFDAIIIGGGVIGLATAHHLSQRGLKCVVVEKGDPGSGSTTRCIGGIRQQFSTEASIKLMQESMRQFQMMEEEFGFSVEFYQGGYLFLAFSRATMESFEKVSRFQKKFGLDVRVLSPDQCLEIVPHLNPTDLLGGVYSPDDGQAYPFKVVEGYIHKIRESGSLVRSFSEVTRIPVSNGKVTGVELRNGKSLQSDIVVNAAGPWAREIGDMVGVNLPVHPERHEAFITDRMEHLFDAMIVDYRSDGCYFQQMTNGQIIGCYTPVPNQPGKHINSTLQFLVEMSKRTVRLIPALERAHVLRHWGGSYSMTPDGSPIIDKTDVPGFYAAVGMSGHGFMFSPAVGRYMADIIVEDTYPFTWDEFTIHRDYSRKEIMK
jgi:sarcosine oxidase subunit beta